MYTPDKTIFVVSELPNDLLFIFDWQFAFSIFVVWGVGVLILSAVMRKELAVIVMFVKVLIVALFFCYFFVPEWQVGGDDQNYFHAAHYIYNLGLDPIRLFAHSHPWYLFNADPGRAVFYLSQYIGLYLFGGEYYSAVLFNVLLTTGTVFFLSKSVVSIGCTRRFSEGLAIFLSLHWSIITWSSFLIVKEPLVTLLIAGVIYGVTLRKQRDMVVRLIVGIICLVALMKVRYYLPFLLMLSVFGAFFFSVSKRIKLTLIAGGLVGAPILMLGVLSNPIAELKYFMGLADFRHSVYEALHFLLQPLPWRITEPARFLFVASTLNIVFAPLAIVGAGLMLYNGSRYVWVVLFILVGGIVFYSFLPDLASTRHRAPFESLIAILQFCGLWFLYQLGRVPCRQAITTMFPVSIEVRRLQ